MKTVINIIRTQDPGKSPKFVALHANEYLTHAGFIDYRNLTKGSIRTFDGEDALKEAAQEALPDRELDWNTGHQGIPKAML